ncbi:unnamed protein product, partial [marine sediment metagenome]
SEVYKWRSWRRPNTFIQTCRLDDGRWGLRIIEAVARGWLEKTSFVVKGGSWPELIEYVSARALPYAGFLSEVK